MTPTIRIDHEVYEKLQEQATPFVDTPNAVLRRLLDLPDGSEPEGRSGRHGHSRRHGGRRGPDARDGHRPRRNKLTLLVESGALSPGDTLIWRRPRSGEEFTATITDDGQLRLDDGSVHDSPSGAGKALNGYDANGWVNWRIESSGQTLRDALLALRGERPGPRGARGETRRRRPRSDGPHDDGGMHADDAGDPPSSADGTEEHGS